VSEHNGSPGHVLAHAPLACADAPNPLWTGEMWGDDDGDTSVAIVRSSVCAELEIARNVMQQAH